MLQIYNGLHKHLIINTMTNEEKLQEIDNAYATVYDGALEMADWKDNQFKTELNRMRNRFHGEESHRAYFALETLNELYNKLFPNDTQPA